MKYLLVGALAVLGGVLGAYLTKAPEVLDFGATTARTTITNPWTFASTTRSGSTGTDIVRMNTGFCNIRASAATIAASSTATVECNGGTTSNVALTGVTAGDKVFLLPATTTPTTFGGIRILGASASSTAGSITARIYNGTGTTFTWTAAASTSLQYWVTK